MGQDKTLYDKLAPDFIALQADLVPVEKSADNPFFRSKYAPLPEVREALQPLLAKHNFGLSVLPQIVKTESGVQNGLHFLLLHKSGQFLEGDWLLTPAKNDSQGQGADVTYKRRQGEMAITGLVADEDDDGNTASFRSAAPQRAAAKSAKPAPAKSEADVKRDQLRSLSESNGWDLAKVRAKFSETVTVNGKPADLLKASADDVEAFITSLETGVVVL